MYVIVAGAGIIGFEITKKLLENKHDVVVIDKDPAVCEFVYAETGAITINGSATDIHILERAGAKKADVIICLMHYAADNIACSLLAKSLGIPRIVTRLRNPHYEEALQLAGVTNIVSAADLLVNQIIMEAEQPKVKKIISLGKGGAEIYAVNIPSNVRSVGMKIKEIAENRNFPKECVFIGIYRKDEEDFLIPRGNHIIHERDTIFLISTAQFIKKATNFLTKSK